MLAPCTYLIERRFVRKALGIEKISIPWWERKRLSSIAMVASIKYLGSLLYIM